MKRNLIVAAVLFFSSPLYQFCHGVGFYNPDQSVAAQGQTSAVAARALDASTVYYNPAGMAHLPPWQATVGCHVLLSDLEYVSPWGQKHQADDTFFVPHVYFSANPAGTRLAAGLGVNSPFGLGTDWEARSFARYVAPYSKLNLIMVNPNLAYSLSDSFSIAAGADYYTADLTFDRFVPSAMFPGPVPPGIDLGTTLDVDGDAWGWNVAFLYDISEQVSLGASYRSKADLDMSGPFKTYPPLPMALSSSLELHLPSMVKAGFAFKPTSSLTLEFDIDWLEWSRFKNVAISFSPPVIPGEVSPREWDDSFLYAIGAEYALAENWKLRAGYGYAQSPIPNRTYEPGIPRNDVHVVSLGVGKSFERLSFDLACTFILSEERKVNSNVGEPFLTVDGSYDSLVTVLGAGLSYNF